MKKRGVTRLTGGISNGGVDPGCIDEIFASNGFDRYPLPLEEPVVERGLQLLLRGWAANAARSSPADALELYLDGDRRPIRYGLLRDDVAKAYGRERIRATGFAAVIETTTLEPGPHELRLHAREGSATLAFAPVTVRVTEMKARTIRSNAFELFAFECDAFYSINRPPSLDAQIERPFVAVVRGRVRERVSGATPRTIYGSIDGFAGVRGLLGYRARDHESSRGAFAICFSTAGLNLGEHSLSIVATNRRGDLGCSAPIAFTVSPICCVPQEPLRDDRIVEAHIAWVGANAIRGWAIDPCDGRAISRASLRFEDGRRIELGAPQYRGDLVAAAKISPDAAFCGFVGSIAFDRFARGHHVGRVFIVSADRTHEHATTATIAFDTP